MCCSGNFNLLLDFVNSDSLVWQVIPNDFLLLQVHNTFHDLEESNILQSYMSDAIKEISKACQAFEVKESAPSTAGV